MDELRNEIWDYIFRAGHPKSIDEIAQQFDQDQETIRKVVDHEWFEVSGNAVMVAFHTPSQQPIPDTDQD